jgi:hypothetical protein
MQRYRRHGPAQNWDVIAACALELHPTQIRRSTAR